MAARERAASASASAAAAAARAAAVAAAAASSRAARSPCLTDWEGGAAGSGATSIGPGGAGVTGEPTARAAAAAAGGGTPPPAAPFALDLASNSAYATRRLLYMPDSSV